MRPRSTVPFAAAIAIAVAAVLAVQFRGEPAIAAGPSEIEIDARQIPSFRIGEPETGVFDGVEWLGGLELTSSNRHFGALSGIAVSEDGSGIVAVTDNGFWVTATLRQDADGRPLGLTGARVAPMLDADGGILNQKQSADAESLAAASWRGKPVWLVAFEREHRVLAYDRGAEFTARPISVPLPKAVRRLRANKGIEAIAPGPAGGAFADAFVIIAERSQGTSPDIPAWLVREDGVSFAFHIRRHDDYDVTDAAFLPEGDLLVLERRFDFRSGIFMRLRRIGAAELRGGVADGPFVMVADFTHQIDNMEGLAVHRSAAGETILTLVSDDNRSILQRTLLLRFRLRHPELETTPLPRPSSLRGGSAAPGDRAPAG